MSQTSAVALRGGPSNLSLGVEQNVVFGHYFNPPVIQEGNPLKPVSVGIPGSKGCMKSRVKWQVKKSLDAGGTENDRVSRTE